MVVKVEEAHEDEANVRHPHSTNSIIALWMFYTSTRNPSDRELKRKKKRTEYKVSPVFVPQVLIQNMGCHTSFSKEARQQMRLSYRRRHWLTNAVFFVPV